MVKGVPLTVLSLHPTRDVILDVPDLALGGVNRARKWFSYPAGKALNAARTAGMLGGDARAILFAPAHWSATLGEFLGKYGVQFTHLPVEGEGRVCVMLNQGKKETVVNTDLRMHPAPGLVARLMALVLKEARNPGFIVVSGSLPPTMGDSRFRALLRVAGSGPARLVLDVSGARLRTGVRHRPWLIKPNLAEFHALTGGTSRSVSGLLAMARGLHRRGVGRVLLSLGDRGCPVGCGDALLGGFLRTVAAGEPEPEALRWGVAAATANLAHPGACLMAPAEIRSFLSRVRLGKA
jgi:fructose-1-phosphate kinase PfkB-like protein